MSFPTSSLSKLTISGMPPTSCTFNRHSHSKDDPATSSDDSSGFEEDSGDDSDTSTSRILTSPNSKLHYDTSGLSPELLSQARAGLKSPLTFTKCTFHTQPSNPQYFAFQVSESAVVRVGEPGSEFSTPTCHCNSEPKPCQHTFFLLDQIAKYTLVNAQNASPLQLSEDGVPREMRDAFQKIKDGKQQLFTQLGCEISVKSSEEPEDPTAAREERIWETRDILASFDKEKSTDEYRPDIFTTALPATTKTKLYPNDLQKTLAVSMISNDNLFNEMRRIVTPSDCATDYFEKKHQKVQGAWRDMEYYVRNKRTPPALTVKPDVAWCADIIENSVDDIMTRIEETSTPLSRSAKETAAGALTKILRDLSRRNIDVYDSPNWRHSREQALDIEHRNIFIHFFGELPEEGEKKFILDDLSNLADAGTSYLEILKEAAESFDAAARAKKIPQAFADKLQRIIKDLKRSGGRNIVGGSKRRGDESGGDTKRMK